MIDKPLSPETCASKILRDLYFLWLFVYISLRTNSLGDFGVGLKE